MKRTGKICIIAALLTALLCGCTSSPVAISVGKTKIDASELAFYMYYNQLNLQNQYRYKGEMSGDLNAQAKENALEQIVTAQVIRNQCSRLGLKMSDEQKNYLKDNKKEFIKTLGGAASYLKYLKDNALTDRTYDKFQENEIYYQLLYNYVAQQDADKLTDVALRQFFSENYVLIQYIRISLLDENGEPLVGDKADNKRKQADAALKEVKAAPERFVEFMSVYNDDPAMTATPEGLVIGRAEAAGTPYLEAAFSLKTGEISSVVQSSDGYYLVRRTEVTPQYFDQNRDMVEQDALDDAFNKELDKWKKETKVSTTNTFQKMTVNNLMSFVQ